MESGYAGTRWTRDNPDCNMKRAARVENYRGFVFRDLAPKVGAARVPRAVESRLRRHLRPLSRRRGRVVPNCFRVIQHSNWKIFLENQLTPCPFGHAPVTGRAARKWTGDRETHR